MIDLDLAAPGIRGAQRFSTTLTNDLSVGGGGFTFWRTELASADASELADYVVGTVLAVGFGLQTAGTGLHDHLAWRAEQDSAMRGNVVRFGSPFGVRTDAFDERELRLKLTERSVYVGCGSVLDALAGSLIGVLGIALEIQRASYRDVRPDAVGCPPARTMKAILPEGSVGGDLQRRTLRVFSTVLQQAGPPGWHEWLSGMRNTALHREARSEIVSTDHTKQEGWRTSRLLPSDPDLSNLQAHRHGSRRLRDLYLHEDTRTTLVELVRSTTAVASATLDLTARVWEDRRADPGLIVQPAKQWRTVNAAKPFQGFAPGTAHLGGSAVMHANSLDVHRLRAGGLVPPL